MDYPKFVVSYYEEESISIQRINILHLNTNESFHEICFLLLMYLSYDVASGSEIKPCNKIDKSLVVYRFWENFMTSITKL